MTFEVLTYRYGAQAPVRSLPYDDEAGARQSALWEAGYDGTQRAEVYASNGRRHPLHIGTALRARGGEVRWIPAKRLPEVAS